MGGSGFAWVVNSLGMLELGQTSKYTNSDIAAETYGVTKTGAIGFKAQDHDI